MDKARHNSSRLLQPCLHGSASVLSELRRRSLRGLVAAKDDIDTDNDIDNDNDNNDAKANANDYDQNDAQHEGRKTKMKMKTIRVLTRLFQTDKPGSRIRIGLPTTIRRTTPTPTPTAR